MWVNTQHIIHYLHRKLCLSTTNIYIWLFELNSVNKYFLQMLQIKTQFEFHTSKKNIFLRIQFQTVFVLILSSSRENYLKIDIQHLFRKLEETPPPHSLQWIKETRQQNSESSTDICGFLNQWWLVILRFLIN